MFYYILFLKNDLKFYFHKFGPYSSKLKYIVQDFVKNGYIIKKKNKYLPNKKKIFQELLSKNYHTDLSFKENEIVSKLKIFFSPLETSRKKELASTIFMIIHKEKIWKKSKVCKRFLELKGDKFDEDDFKIAWRLLDCFDLLKPRKEKIFLSGADDAKLTNEVIYESFLEINLEPIWYHRNFPEYHNDVIKRCILNVENSDRFILVLHQRYGSYYENSEISVLEMEFNAAFEQRIPILVFIDYETYEEAKIYSQIKSDDFIFP